MKKVVVTEIRHAAVKAVNGQIFLGKRHSDCFAQAGNLKIKMSSKADDQGFMTSTGNFVDRKKAAKVARKAKQLEVDTEILFSEDICSAVLKNSHSYDSIKGYYK